MDSGVKSRVDSGVNPGVDSGVDSGVNSGVDSGVWPLECHFSVFFAFSVCTSIFDHY